MALGKFLPQDGVLVCDRGWRHPQGGVNWIPETRICQAFARLHTRPTVSHCCFGLCLALPHLREFQEVGVEAWPSGCRLPSLCGDRPHGLHPRDVRAGRLLGVQNHSHQQPLRMDTFRLNSSCPEPHVTSVCHIGERGQRQFPGSQKVLSTLWSVSLSFFSQRPCLPSHSSIYYGAHRTSTTAHIPPWETPYLKIRQIRTKYSSVEFKVINKYLEKHKLESFM